jgi:hypothetical protein
MIVPNQRENIVTEYAFSLKHSHFNKFSHPKKWCWRPSKYTGNFSNCFIVLYKHLWTLKLKRQISHAYMWSLVSQFFYIFMSFESWSLDQCFLLFHFLILKVWQNWLFFVPKFAIGLEIKIVCHLNLFQHKSYRIFIVLAYQGKNIVFTFIIEYTSLRDFGPYVIGLFLYEDL